MEGEEGKKIPVSMKYQISRDQDKGVERQNLTNIVAIKNVLTIIDYVEQP